ncbi:response regulator transcription factor [Pelotomaculum isophthalicicum JI]|uniref:Stage 0 sporulation protein A homolog n=1 Tax=Pelotomaculum isophthalicicum JI TaxID=947010 RepID=A0A9X4H4P3_9FIRM|nr:response regulator transcription factor [Pelotomaculum isophthalicicum]MDF9408898.1 response regulator transcription factor [Pelotomaculum isophthalicicum JI]
MPLLLVVDDEAHILQLLKYNLTKEGYQVIEATNGNDAIKLTGEKAPDLIILDKMLPEMDGFDVLRILKANRQSASIPVIMLSARSDELDKVLGLELGADDYITKPFSPRELVARVKVHLRRGQMLSVEDEPAEVEEVRINGLVIQPEKYEALLDGVRLELTQKEFELLHLLAGSPGRVFTRDILLEKIWGYDFEPKSRTVDVHISYLRQKIEKDPANPKYIETVRGVGYRFREIH